MRAAARRRRAARCRPRATARRPTATPIEARLYAEDPARGWLPQTGTAAPLRRPAATRRSRRCLRARGPPRRRRRGRRRGVAPLRRDAGQGDRLGADPGRGGPAAGAAPCAARASTARPPTATCSSRSCADDRLRGRATDTGFSGRTASTLARRPGRPGGADGGGRRAAGRPRRRPTCPGGRRPRGWRNVAEPAPSRAALELDGDEHERRLPARRGGLAEVEGRAVPARDGRGRPGRSARGRRHVARPARPVAAPGDRAGLRRHSAAGASPHRVPPRFADPAAAARQRLACSRRCPAPWSRSRSSAGRPGRGRPAAAGARGDEDAAHRDRADRGHGHRAARRAGAAGRGRRRCSPSSRRPRGSQRRRGSMSAFTESEERQDLRREVSRLAGKYGRTTSPRQARAGGKPPTCGRRWARRASSASTCPRSTAAAAPASTTSPRSGGARGRRAARC